MPDGPIRIAFVKFAGLSAGGTERWLQMMAANLDRGRFAVDYFYCDAAPYIGSDFEHPDTDMSRVDYMERAGVNLVKFHVGAKNVTTPTHDWVDTDFWEKFDPSRYDLVQTAKAGPQEYPYDRISIPFVEYVTLSAGVDQGPNLALSIHLSQWQRREWAGKGGDLAKSEVIPIPAEAPATDADLRDELGIPAGDLVAGFHQRAQDEIFSPIPLEAFESVAGPGRWFVVMGGSDRYRRQAAELGLDNVVFVEHHGGGDRISRFLNTLDVFAHGRYDGETFGTVFAEAMMHSKPCLSHRSPIANAQPETMGPAGLFAEDAADYAGKLEALFGDRALYEKLAAKARPHAENYYSLDSCVWRLEQVYESVTGRPVTSGAEQPLPYGQSDLGFLVAGDIDDPASVAHHVATGDAPPDEPVIDLLRHLMSDEDTLVEVGSANSLVALAAPGRRTLDAPAGPEADAVRATVSLNNWEDRFQLGAAEDADFVVVNSGAPGREVNARGLFVKGPLDGRTARLGDWSLRLDAALAAQLPAWRRQRRRARIEHAMGAPGRAVTRARPRVGAVVYGLRRKLPF